MHDAGKSEEGLRSSVLAAANPIYGQYDISKKPQDNVGLPDSLLSRFDLLFIGRFEWSFRTLVRDEIDPKKDHDIAEHVLQVHRFVRPGHENIPEMDLEDEKVDQNEMYVKSTDSRYRQSGNFTDVSCR